MPTLSTQIEIAAPPSKVSEIFHDFAKYPEWSTAFIKSIEVTSAADKTNPVPGDKLKVVLPGATFSPVLLINTPEQFKWRGSLPGIFTGDHSFRFTPSTTTPGGTTVLQSEEFSGLLSFLYRPTASQGKKTTAGFEGFNRDLKARCEALAATPAASEPTPAATETAPPAPVPATSEVGPPAATVSEEPAALAVA